MSLAQEAAGPPTDISHQTNISGMLIISIMLMTALRALDRFELRPRLIESRSPDSQFDALVDIELDGMERRFAVEVRSRAPYTTELRNLDSRRVLLSSIATPLLIAPYVSETLGMELSRAGWSWADGAGNFDIRAPQIRAKQRLSFSPPKPSKGSVVLPQGSGSLFIVRYLINRSAPNAPIGHQELAAIAGVSQPRATQVIKQLREAQLITGRGSDWVADRPALLDAFLTEYKGPGGSEFHFYSLDSPLITSQKLIQWSDDKKLSMAISADVGPDLIAPWRHPSHVVAYVDRPFNLGELNLAEAEARADANVSIRIPQDSSVFPSQHQIQVIDDSRFPCVDVTQMIWDLVDLGGSDRVEAADHLRQWLLNR
jgi:hypothetical protein